MRFLSVVKTEGKSYSRSLDRCIGDMLLCLRICKVRPMVGWFKAWAEGRRGDAQGGRGDAEVAGVRSRKSA